LLVKDDEKAADLTDLAEFNMNGERHADWKTIAALTPPPSIDKLSPSLTADAFAAAVSDLDANSDETRKAIRFAYRLVAEDQKSCRWLERAFKILRPQAKGALLEAGSGLDTARRLHRLFSSVPLERLDPLGERLT
jgi:hypothetical protein